MSTGFLKGLWLIPILLFLNCSVTYQGQMWGSPQRGILSGRVSLEDGRGWDDVEVILAQITGPQQLKEQRQLVLDERGEFWVEDLAPGNYYLMVNKPRYDSSYREIHLEKGDGLYLEVQLRRYSIPGRVEEVAVVGDFVDWDPQKALPMTDDDGDGIWETATPLPPGRYSYKYIINGMETWFIDIYSGIYEPDGFGYYNSVMELREARRVDFVLNTNDPWFHRRTFVAYTPTEGGLVIAGQVEWEPEEPRQGQNITILYDPQGGPLEDAERISLHWGVNGWTIPQAVPTGTSDFGDGRAVETPMERDSDGIWHLVVPTDREVWAVDFVFTDGQRWDNNQTEDWHVPVK